jgi:lysophospholipase L1-like esterase
MKSIKLYLFFSLLLITIQQVVIGQPYINEIQAFKKKDSLNPPPKHAVLFVGSSSFRKWTDAEQIFSRYPVINRAFGGSTLPDVIRYADDVIFPYQSRQIVVYCGDNDLASSDAVTVDTVVQRFQTLFNLIRSKMPQVPIAFVSIKPSPSRKKLMPKMVEANAAIKQFLSKQQKTKFINVYNAMLLPNGYPNGALFESDSLHMLPAGYVIWKKKIEPALIKSKVKNQK